MPQDNAATDITQDVRIGREYDISGEIELREGPGTVHPKKVNQRASDVLKAIHYLSVDSSVTVRVHAINNGWAEVQVTQPKHLATSHRGWVPMTYIREGAASNKLEGWIRHTCLVYVAKSRSSKAIGYLHPPASVGVSDDGSGWLRLIHGPIKVEGANRFVENPNFDAGLYIEAGDFTTIIPGKWNQ